MSMTSFSVILAVLTSNINHRGQKEKPVPNWLVTLLSVLAKVMCMDLKFLKPKRQQSRHEWQKVPQSHSSNRPYRYISTAVSGDSGCLTDYENSDNHAHAHLGNSCGNSHSNHMLRQPSGPREENKDLVVILQKLDELLSREDDRERVDECIRQWVEVAEIADRFFFWLFVIGTTFVSLFLLVVYPLFKETGGMIPEPINSYHA
jgi:hypothetical protein